MTKQAVARALTPEEIARNKEKEAETWSHIDMKVEHAGEKIILPESPIAMSEEEAIRALKRVIEQKNRVYAIDEPIQCHFFDGLVALAIALKEKYGFVATDNRSIETFFGKMEKPPILLHIKTGPGPKDMIQVPFGTFRFPGVEGSIQTEFGMSKGIPVVRLTGNVRSKERDVVMQIILLAQEIAKTRSIYRSKSIILKRDERDGGVNLGEPLDFFDPKAGMEVPIFNRDTEKLIQITVKSLIQNSEWCREKKIPLKRGILLEGPYGTGKTLTAREIARVANENGWTFILVTAASALKYALTFAKMYQPCVVFAEDIDRIAGDRNEGANDLINEIDGVVGKNDEIITVLTTNFADRIDRAFLRPGRLDAVISLRAPDPEAAERLIRFYGGAILDPKSDLASVTTELAGNIPAVIREVVERSKLAARVEGRDMVTAEDLHVSAVGMKNHLDLSERAKEGVIPADPITVAIGKVVSDEARKLFEEYI